MENKKETTFEFGIRAIKPVSFFINESIDIPAEITISYQLDMAFDEQKETVDLIVGATFTNKPSEGLLLYTGSALTRFYLKNLKDFIDKENVLNVPNSILEILFSIAFSHTRSILATHTNGTKFSEFTLPVINPGIVLKQLYDALMKRHNQAQVL